MMEVPVRAVEPLVPTTTSVAVETPLMAVREPGTVMGAVKVVVGDTTDIPVAAVKVVVVPAEAVMAVLVVAMLSVEPEPIVATPAPRTFIAPVEAVAVTAPVGLVVVKLIACDEVSDVVEPLRLMAPDAAIVTAFELGLAANVLENEIADAVDMASEVPLLRL